MHRISHPDHFGSSSKAPAAADRSRPSSTSGARTLCPKAASGPQTRGFLLQGPPIWRRCRWSGAFRSRFRSSGGLGRGAGLASRHYSVMTQAIRRCIRRPGQPWSRWGLGQPLEKLGIGSAGIPEPAVAGVDHCPGTQRKKRSPYAAGPSWVVSARRRIYERPPTIACDGRSRSAPKKA